MSRLRDRRIPGSKPDPTKDPSCMCVCCTFNLTARITRAPAGVVQKFGEGDATSVVIFVILPRFEGRVSSQNSPRIALKWVVDNGSF
ncbi:hypothetical protein AVEN_105953-1 [Araneus ventricosus]|uniref:Uncharacterized protein n=1 Tax=Araneus ventricosus TaxID=182803 RepID=A0A4Y2DV33_ARAVE|nr:hypothetical protein AVEN_105953-1 [Araneus ventricosus]